MAKVRKVRLLGRDADFYHATSIGANSSPVWIYLLREKEICQNGYSQVLSV